MQKLILGLAAALLLATTLHAETTILDPIVVTATRTETPLSQLGSSVTVVTAEEIEEKQLTQVLDVLRSVPGVNIVQSGPRGTATSAYLRGTDTRHTLVLIDGIEFRDTSSIGGGSNLANISTENIERIEVVKGAQSVIYGSDAIGGVINIITKKGSRNRSTSASLEGGSYNTREASAAISAPGISAAVSTTTTDGFSSYNEKDGFSEKDGYKKTSFMLNSGHSLSESLAYNLSFHLTDSESEFDSYDWTFTPADTDAKTDSLETAAKGELIFSLLQDVWTLKLGSSISSANHKTSGTYDNYEYDGDIKKAEVLNTIRAGELQTLLLGFEIEKEDYQSSYGDSGDTLNRAVYIQDQLKISDFAISVGARLDNHQEFGNEVTWRIAPSYVVPYCGAHLHASVGTGFKAPSLFQLYYPYGGNADLDPETSLSYDIGFDQKLLSNSIVLSATWFHNDIEDYINWYGDWLTGGYENIEELTTEGVETSIGWYPLELISFKLGYTYTDSETDDGSRKARIPLHKGSFDISIYPLDNLQLTTSILYTGEREDGAANETLDAYTLVNLSGSYQVCDYAKLFARIDNLFDEDYEEVAGYGTAGLSAYAGLKVTF